jgi:uncharacterized protein (TIGR03437 family)
VALAACTLLAARAHGGIILDIPNGGTASAFARPPTTYGWSFKITSSLTVAALGVWDEGSVGLKDQHPVGLWDSGGNMIVSLTVNNADSFPVPSTSTNGRWLFTNLTPAITIPAGTYVLGAYYPHSTDVGDKFRESLNPTTVSGVTDVDRRDAGLNSGGLAFPNQNILIPTGYFGPNLSTDPVGSAAQTPSIASGGILNGASFVPGQPVTAGSLISIFGTNLASSMAQADTIPLSNSLGSVSVQFISGTTTLNAPMLFVTGPGASSQINAQVPWSLVPANSTQNANVVVTVNGLASAPSQVTVGPFSPGIFTTGPPDFRAIAQNVDGTLAQPAGSISGLTTHPVKVGDALIVYATGLGPVDSTPADGAIPPSGTLVNTQTKPTVLVGGVSADVLFSGLTPQFVGVNQVNIVIPNVPADDKVPLQFQMGGITSPKTVTIAVTQ